MKGGRMKNQTIFTWKLKLENKIKNYVGMKQLNK